MKLNKRKGFTIVELVIVIAVIAILAAVLIPNISNLVKKANASADESLVRNLNTALSMDVEKHQTMDAALEAALKNGGYELTTIVTKNKDNKILWDSKNDCFVYMKKGASKPTYLPNTQEVKDVEDVDYFEIVTEKPTDFSKFTTYSVYAAWTAEEGDTVTGLKVGFDAGKNKFASINFALDATEEKTVTINTTSGKLTIDAAKGIVNHHGDAAEVVITKIDNASYHEFGTVNTLTVKQGHVKVEAKATINNIIVDKSAGADVSLDNKGTVNAVAGASDLKTVSGVNDDAKFDRKTTLTADGGYIKLENGQTIDSTLYLTKDTILDLNGKILTLSNGVCLVVKCNLTIIDSSETQNGKIEEAQLCGKAMILIQNGHVYLNAGNLVAGSSYNTDELSYKQVVDIEQNSSLTVNGGLIYNKISIENPVNDFTGCAVAVWGKNANVVVNAGVVKSDFGFGLAGNGGVGYGGTKIEINGGKIYGGENAIYHPQDGALNISGGYIEGNTAIDIKCGVLTITGGEIKATGTKKAFKFNGNGSTDTGDAILIESCSYPGGNPVAHTIANAKISSANGYTIVGYITYRKANMSEAEKPYIVITSNLTFDIFAGVQNGSYEKIN